MRCSFCGLDFDLETAEEVCASCPIARGCHLVRCPNCGYEMPPESKMLGRLRDLRERLNRDGQGNGRAAISENGLTSLDQMAPGQGGEIASLSMDDPKALNKMLAMNMMPGVAIKLLQRSPSFVLQAGFSQFAVDEEIARLIQVRIG